MGYALLNNHLIACNENDLPTERVSREKAQSLNKIHGGEMFTKLPWWPTLENAERHMRLFAKNDFERFVFHVSEFYPEIEPNGSKLGWARIPQPIFDEMIKAHQRKWGKYAMRSFRYWRVPMPYHHAARDLFHEAHLADFKANRLLTADLWPETA